MPLKVELKPGERFILGQSVVTNGDQRATILVEGGAPVLREKDILRTQDADTPAKRIYLAIQLMYFSADPRPHHGIYFELVTAFAQAAPSARLIIEGINNLILTDAYYKALREAKRLIAYEKELLSNA